RGGFRGVNLRRERSISVRERLLGLIGVGGFGGLRFVKLLRDVVGRRLQFLQLLIGGERGIDIRRRSITARRRQLLLQPIQLRLRRLRRRQRDVVRLLQPLII